MSELHVAAFAVRFLDLADARRRQLPEPSPLQLIRRQDLLAIELPPAALSAHRDIFTGIDLQDDEGGDHDHG